MVPRSPEQVSRESEQTRRKLLASEAAVLLLLLRRHDEAIGKGLRRGWPIQRIAGAVGLAAASAVADGRQLARLTGRSRLKGELQSIGLRLGTDHTSAAELAYDIGRAERAGRSFGDRWFRKAIGETTSRAAALANVETLGSVRRIGVTESAEAFNRGRARYLQEARISVSLMRVWDATLDRRTCPICEAADGTIVAVGASFPLGEPGAVHPLCRCVFSILTAHESKHALLIEAT